MPNGNPSEKISQWFIDPMGEQAVANALRKMMGKAYHEERIRCIDRIPRCLVACGKQNIMDLQSDSSFKISNVRVYARSATTGNVSRIRGRLMAEPEVEVPITPQHCIRRRAML